MLENNIVAIGGEKRPSNTFEVFEPEVRLEVARLEVNMRWCRPVSGLRGVTSSRQCGSRLTPQSSLNLSILARIRIILGLFIFFKLELS